MSSIYVHIPFCKKRCTYCNFFSTTLLQRQEDYVNALTKEIILRKEYITNPTTIYLGGGTPFSKDLRSKFTILVFLRTKLPYHCINYTIMHRKNQV